MNTNRSGTRGLTVAKARYFMHVIYDRAYAAGRAEAEQPLKSEAETKRIRLDLIKEVLQE